VICFINSGCKKADVSSNSSSKNNFLKEALDTAADKVNRAVPDTSSISLASLSTQSSLASFWEDSDFALGGDFGSSPKDSVRVHGDPSSQNSLMYQFHQALENLCVFTTSLPSTGGDLEYTSGHVLVLSSKVKAELSDACDVDLSGVLTGKVIGYKVEDVEASTGSHFDTKVSFDVDGNSTYNQYANYFYYRIEDAKIRFLYTENGENASAALFEYDLTTGLSRFEFSEVSSTPYTTHYRVLLNELNSEGLFSAYVENASDSMQAVAKTSVEGGNEIAVSYSFVDNGSNDLTDGNACIGISDFNIVTDNTLACLGVTGFSASSYLVDHSGVSAASIGELDETTELQWNSSFDFLTADPMY
tara:strand:+ start:17665 stop:18744 length:1080 start_codon:yes stop_codon:yes gene_type:complete